MSKLVLLACVVVVAAGCRRTPTPSGVDATPTPSVSTSVTEAAPSGTLRPSLFARGDAQAEGIVLWNDGIVARTKPLRWIDPTSAKASPLRITGCKAIDDVANGLVVHGAMAAMGTFDAGVTLLDLGTLAVRRVFLE